MRRIRPAMFLRRRDGDDPQRAAAAVDDLERRGNHDRPCRRQLIEIAQAGEPELAGAVHRCVIGKRRVEPAGARTVKLAFESARFDVLVAWIEALATSYGVEAVELSVDRADGVGFVNARVTLQDAP